MMASSIRSKLDKDFCLMMVSSLSVKSKMGLKMYCVEEEVLDAQSAVVVEVVVVVGKMLGDGVYFGSRGMKLLMHGEKACIAS
jgi:hypothetical protein